VKDLEGRAVDPFAGPKPAARVIIFIAVDCPIANRYAPEIRRLEESYAPKNVAFTLVHADPDATAEQARRHRDQYQLPGLIVLDPAHVLVKRCKAEVTPEAALFNSAGELVYHGRISNLYEAFGKARRQATEHDLQEAIDAVLAGRKVARAHQRAIGCYIPGGKP